jgi:acyl dehydratase
MRLTTSGSHLDAERAKAGPYRTTIAQLLRLSLLPEMSASASVARDAVGVGLNKVRFPAPVPCGSRLRGHFKLIGYEASDGAQLTMQVTMERGGADRSASPSRLRAAMPDRACDEVLSSATR